MKEKISKSFNSNSTKCSNNNNYNKSNRKLSINTILFMNNKEKNFFLSNNKNNNKITSLKQIERNINLKFKKLYLLDNNFYNIKIINEIIFNESTHIVSLFKEILINDDNSEFFQNYYSIENSRKILPKIYEYYIACSVIFPNYVILPESKYIYKNIQRKQRVIDNQQELEDKLEREKRNIYNNNNFKYFDEEPDDTVFTTEAFDSILNQTNTSEAKRIFGIKDSYYKGNNSSIYNIIKIIEEQEEKKSKKKIINMNLKKNIKIRKKSTNSNKNTINEKNKQNKNNYNEMYFKRNFDNKEYITFNNNKGRNYKRNNNSYKSNSLLNYNNLNNINNSKIKNIYSTIDVELKNNIFSNNNYLFLNNNNKGNINKKIIFSILSNNKNIFLKKFFKKKVTKNSDRNNIINSHTTRRNIIKNIHKYLSLTKITKDFKNNHTNLNIKNEIHKIPLTTRENNTNNHNKEIINLISKKIDKKKNKIQLNNKSISPHKSKNLILNSKSFLPINNINPSGSIKSIKGIHIKGFDELIKNNNKNYSRNLINGFTNSERYFNSYNSNSSRSIKKGNTKKNSVLSNKYIDIYKKKSIKKKK